MSININSASCNMYEQYSQINLMQIPIYSADSASDRCRSTRGTKMSRNRTVRFQISGESNARYDTH